MKKVSELDFLVAEHLTTLDQMIERLKFARKKIGHGDVAVCVAVPGSNGFTTPYIRVTLPTVLLAEGSTRGTEALVIGAFPAPRNPPIPTTFPFKVIEKGNDSESN